MTVTTTEDQPVVEPAPVSIGEHTRTWAAGLRGRFTPPDLWTNDRPSLRQSWEWAVRGEHLPDDDPVRLTACIVAGITIPLRAVLLYLDWLLEHPSRLVAAAVLVFAVIQAVNL
jgi:hypothetical protein